MTPKEEAIKKAYGAHWENLKQHIDHDGWCYTRKKIGFDDIKKELQTEMHPFNTYFFRPKSLSGIENNNGWIKIESKEDLPKETCRYFAIIKGSFKPKIQTYKRDDDNDAWRRRITHYQPIIKPKPPIY